MPKFLAFLLCPVLRLVQSVLTAVGISPKRADPVPVPIEAAGYARVANDGVGGLSLERQRIEVARHAASLGFVVCETHSDVGSGNRINPGLAALMEGAEAGRFSAIVVSDCDRLSRSLPDLIALWRRFQELGVKVHTFHDGEVTGTSLVFGHLTGSDWRRKRGA